MPRAAARQTDSGLPLELVNALLASLSFECAPVLPGREENSGPGAQYWRKNSHPKARKAEDLVQPNKSDWLLRKASPARCAAVTQSSLESGRWLLALLFL